MSNELKKEAEKREATKQDMIVEEMKKYTLRENVKRILSSLASIGLERSLLNMIPDPDRTEIQKAREMGSIAALAPICESLKAALDNSLPD